jgi:hypothetical protein
VTGTVIVELSACSHCGKEMAAAHDALVQLVILKCIRRDVSHLGPHVDVFVAEFTHVQVDIVQQLVGIAVGSSRGGDGRPDEGSWWLRRDRAGVRFGKPESLPESRSAEPSAIPVEPTCSTAFWANRG